MRRDLRAMTAKNHDLIVIGGGIAGGCNACDASPRGLSVALLEKGDFAGAAASAASELIHGGFAVNQRMDSAGVMNPGRLLAAQTLGQES